MNILIVGLYSNQKDKIIFDNEPKKYGNYLYFPINTLCEILKSEGHFLFTSKFVDLDTIDLVIFLDINKELLSFAELMPTSVKKLLIVFESPIYCSLGHSNSIFLNIWDKVITYNRDFSCANITHYDIPVTGNIEQIEFQTVLNRKKYNKGVAVSSYKNDIRGYVPQRRDRLLKLLSKMNRIDLYGNSWKNGKNIFGPTVDKIETMSKYSYALTIENSVYNGYVTEKLGDAILAGLPSIYYGDFINAERRFPGVFVQLEDLTIESFLEAEKKLWENYEMLMLSVEKQYLKSREWIDSFIQASTRLIHELECELESKP